jgi:hypothetical protein
LDTITVHSKYRDTSISGQEVAKLTLELSAQSLIYEGAGRRIRTDDLLITNQLLYQLSYAGNKNARPAGIHSGSERRKVAQSLKTNKAAQPRLGLDKSDSRKSLPSTQ